MKTTQQTNKRSSSNLIRNAITGLAITLSFSASFAQNLTTMDLKDLALTPSMLTLKIGSGAGGKIGSGAGGGQLLNQISLNGDVEVPYPGDDDSTCVVVNGEPGPSQLDTFKLETYEETRDGKPMAFSNKEVGRQNLNKAICAVEPGPLLIYYSNSVLFIKKESGQKLTVELRKIKVPRSKEPITFDVFRDLTNQKEKIKMQIEMHTFASNREQASNLLKILKVEDPFLASEIEQKIANNDLDYLKHLIKFDVLGNWHNFNVSSNNQTWLNQGRVMITDPKDGEFVSVLPGVYGIQWKSSTGQSSATYGIVVD